MPGPADPRREEPTPRAGLLAGLVTPWGPTLEQPIPEGLHPMEGTHAGAVNKDLQPMGRTPHWDSWWRTVSRGRDPTLEQGRSVRRKERQRMCDELTTASTSHPPAQLGGEEVAKIRSEVEPGNTGGVGGRCFKIWLCFSLFYSDFDW